MVSLLFYLRKYKTDRIGRSMIYVRITINGKRSEFSTGRKIHASLWDAAYGKVFGFSQEVRQLNSHLINRKVLPVLTNQKMNAYLKEIADLSGIKKNLTTHFGQTYFCDHCNAL